MLFRPIETQDKNKYEKLLFRHSGKGCEFTFANLILWGQRFIAFVDDHVVLYSNFEGRWYYTVLMGSGDKRDLFDNILKDAESKNIKPVFIGIYEGEKEVLEQLYPDKFDFTASRGSFDYVYSIDDLADLSGKKYHRKRNHLSQFQKACPDFCVQPITVSMLPAVAAMADEWYKKRAADAPEIDFETEKTALSRAIANYEALGMDGMVLMCGERIIAFTMASRMSADTMDIHFEKAVSDINGAYAAINYEFARYLRAKYPDIRFLDREEDMGIEGLRKAKESYYPHHLAEKYRAAKK
ncbi:MAG: DUF2156 domain-containing protein [Clostridia bacterium]|nr:DUF2156 domain-containing protein [Clostridia bacterium]